MGVPGMGEPGRTWDLLEAAAPIGSTAHHSVTLADDRRWADAEFDPPSFEIWDGAAASEPRFDSHCFLALVNSLRGTRISRKCTSHKL